MASWPTITVGTRGSRLALRQTGLVVDALRKQDPDLNIQIKEIATQGDRDQRTSLTTIGGQGVFVKELESAMLNGEVDIAVHSLKDVPADVAAGLVLAGFPERGDPRDALVTSDNRTLDELSEGGRVGTGSRRRAVQLLALRPDIKPMDIRGNVDTRVRKVDEGEFDAVVLAYVGLQRLGIAERASQIFEPDEMIPSVGQGALVVEAREGDDAILDLLGANTHEPTRIASEAERAFMARLGGGCRLPFGAYAHVEGDTLTIRGFVANEEGGDRVEGGLAAPRADASEVGTRLAEQLLSEGAAEFMEAVS